MKKISLILSIFLLLSIIYHISSNVSAQEVQQARERQCLQATQVGGQTVTPPDPVTLVVTGKGFPSGKKIDVEFCPPGEANIKTQCEKLSSVTAQGGKVKTDYTLSGLRGHVSYPFYGTWPHEELPMGKAETQQQGTLTFEQNAGKCTSIVWDPYGRVFDSQSLEPIPNVKVSVLNKINPDALTQIVNNPQIVKNDGAFNFLIEPGTYFLKLVAPLIYSFSATPNLNPNYAQAYSKRDGTSSIYKPNESIVEKAGKPEHRDIPLDPGKNPPSHFLIVNIPGNYEQMVFGSITKYGGKISHPLSTVALIGVKSKKEIARITADKFGYWNILLDNLKVPQNEALVIKLIKVDLTTGRSDEKNARITDDVTFEPILRIVQGYTYNSSGVVVPNATVQIVREGKNKTYYQINSDKNGYFSISINNLPVNSYHVVLKTSAGITVEQVSTSVFASRNTPYLSKNQLNLMKSQTKTPSGKDSLETSAFSDNKGKLNSASSVISPTEVMGTKQKLLPFFLLLLVLLGVAGTSLLVLNSSKKKSRRKK